MLTAFLMLAAEVESAAMLAAVWFTAADVRQATVYFLVAARIVAPCRHAVADVALPSVVVSD